LHGEDKAPATAKNRSATLENFDVVRVVAIRGDRFAGQPLFYSRHPKLGDVACIVETHRAGYAYEVECSDPNNGKTLWLDTMYIDASGLASMTRAGQEQWSAYGGFQVAPLGSSPNSNVPAT
jgi:hypothetical protein